MDSILEQLVTYTSELSSSVLTDSVKDAAVRHLVDTIACSIAGYDSEAARVATKVAAMVPSDEGATVFGSNSRVIPELAAFANTTMVRAWDWNDGMFAKGGGHASDMIPALLAVGEVAGSTPEEILLSLVLSYECLGALGNATSLRKMNEKGEEVRSSFDQGTFMCPAAALGIGKLLGLNEQQLATAAALAIFPGSPHGGGRWGHSMWKCSATGESMRGAIFAVTLAQQGMSAPLEPFEGPGGLWDKLTPPFNLQIPARPGGPTVVEMCYMKRYPAELHTLAAVDLAPGILAWTPVEEIESIVVETYHQAYWALTGRPSTYDPKIREEADHSYPYVLAVSLADGKLSRDSYRSERVLDPALRPLMQKIEIRENQEFTDNFRPKGTDLEIIGQPHTRITVRNRAGQEHVEEMTFGKGHAMNPLLEKDINEKLDEACAGIVSDEQKEQIREAWWNLDKAKSIAEPIKTLSSF